MPSSRPSATISPIAADLGRPDTPSGKGHWPAAWPTARSITSRTLRTVHRLSAIVLGAFLVSHIANHLTALGGVAAHGAFMDAARVVYRWPPVETLLLASAVVQALSGLALAWRARRRRGVWTRLQIVSGACLAFFLLAHVSAILFIRHELALDTNFYAAAMVLTVGVLPFIYAPYYGMGVLALFVHAACAVRNRVGQKRGTRPARALIGGGALVAVVIVAAHAGWLYEVDLPAPYRAAAESYLPW